MKIVFLIAFLCLGGLAMAQQNPYSQQPGDTNTGTPLGRAPSCNGWNC